VFDKVVGEDAKGKWDKIAARHKDKVRLLEQTGATGFDLTKQHDGSYAIMTPQQRAASERTRAFHFKMDAAGPAQARKKQIEATSLVPKDHKSHV
jgi:hypothetical protein